MVCSQYFKQIYIAIKILLCNIWELVLESYVAHAKWTWHRSGLLCWEQTSHATPLSLHFHHFGFQATFYIHIIHSLDMQNLEWIDEYAIYLITEGTMNKGSSSTCISHARACGHIWYFLSLVTIQNCFGKLRKCCITKILQK